VFFARWLDSMHFTEQSAAVLTEAQTLSLLGAYLYHLRHGMTIQKSTTLADQTLRLYIAAAANVFTILTNRRCIAHDPATMHQKQPALHPFLREQLTQRANWKKPKAKIEPFTEPMFAALFNLIRASTDPLRTFLGPQAAVFDWTRLGIFTGSRLGEYGQSRRPKNVRYNTIPKSVDAGEWAGRSLAFIQEDFTFFTSTMIAINNDNVYLFHASSSIQEVHIRFRFDKSKTNFTIRKFRGTGHNYIDPIDASVSIFRRAQYLKVPLEEPLGVYSSSGSSYSFISDGIVKRVMQHSCILAYPNPAHELRVKIKSIVAHSNRVTAAVCLQQGGASIDEIAFRLRWQPGSVPTYLRECYQGVGAILQKTILGIYRSS
jgi:hypothetical protein